jgi:hypothetical protein
MKANEAKRLKELELPSVVCRGQAGDPVAGGAMMTSTISSHEQMRKHAFPSPPSQGFVATRRPWSSPP